MEGANGSDFVDPPLPRKKDNKKQDEINFFP